MKTRFTILLIIVGIIISIVGALIKILHLPLAEFTLLIGGLIETTGWLLFLIKVLHHPKLKEILDW